MDELTKVLKQLVDGQQELALQLKSMAIRQGAEISALKVVIGALVASHPDPDSFRKSVADASAASMLSLSASHAGQEMKDATNTQAAAAISAMLSLLPRTD